MTLQQGLSLRQTQKLAMTPELRNAIEILAYGHADIERFVAEQVEANPLIAIPQPEIVVKRAPARPTAAGADHAISAATPGSADRVLDGGTENLYGSAGVSEIGEAGFDPIDALVESVGMRDHLRRQIPLIARTRQEERLAGLLVDLLDPDGYLREDLAVAAVTFGVTLAQMERALLVLQCCEPTGIAARSLPERFRLQLAERGELDAKMVHFLECLDRVSRGEEVELRREVEARGSDYGALLARLRRLDADPCARFDTRPSAATPPDILVRRDNLGGWGVELNPETLPRVVMDRTYAATVSADGSATRFVRDCMSHGTWLMRALDQRAETILKVAGEIVRRQHVFFTDGIAGLRPLTLREVAETTGLHESTVSRATRAKFLDCERGLFELRFFFSAAIARKDDAEGASATAIRDRIRGMIGAETRSRPLSDDAIVRSLKSEGVTIARRTVTKYREAMNIPSSVERRRLYGGTVKLTS